MIGVCVLLALAVLAVFAQTTRFEFVNFDDQQYVYENPVVEKGLSAKAVYWAFTHPQVGDLIPLTTLSHMLGCQLFGLRAGWHHMLNVLCHAANVVLLFLVLRRMTGSLWRSAFVAAVFAVHPLRAESVAWVSERKDVLSGLFFMLTIGAYVRNARKPSGAGQAAVVVLFALGLLAKTMVATLPFVLLLLDYWPLGRLQNRRQFRALVAEKIPLFALSATACIVAALTPGLIVKNVQRIPLLQRLGNAVVSYVVYLGQMIFPSHLAAYYPNALNGRPLWMVCLAFVLLAVVSAGVVACRSDKPFLLVGWLWYLGMLVPVIGIIQISSGAAHADRYTYLPEIGLAIAGTWAVGDLSLGWKLRPIILGGLMVAVAGALIVLGHRQTGYWRDSASLWTRTLACTADNAGHDLNVVAHKGLGDVFSQHGNLDAAIVQYRKALEIQPNNADYRVNLGSALSKMGQINQAIEQYRKALEINPNYEVACYSLGTTLAACGKLDEAIAQYRKALEIDPDYVAARSNLGIALFDEGKYDEAIGQYRKALEIDPACVTADYNLANALVKEGQLDDALAHYRHALKLKPDYALAHYGLAIVLCAKQQWPEAIAQFRNALEINPDFAQAREGLGGAYANLGLAFFQKGETREAIDSWQHALEVKPDQGNVQNNLAWLLATAPDASLRNGARAVTLAERANQLSGGGNPIVLHTLAAAYAEAGHYGDAAATARRALEFAAAQKNDDLTAKLQMEITLYEADKPVRDAPQ